MRKTFAKVGIAAVLGYGCAVAVSSAQAATLAGDTFDISLYYPNRNTLYQDLGDFVDNNTYMTNPLDPKGVGRLGPYSIRYIFGQAHTFKTAPFDGIVFEDETKSLIANVAFNHSTNAIGLTASDLSYTSNSVFLDLSGVTVQAGSVIQIDFAFKAAASPKLAVASLAVPSVPLPASAPMFGAALLALAGFGYGMRRRATLQDGTEPQA